MTNTDVFPLWSGKKIAVNPEAETAPLSDHALAIAAGGGDIGAFEELYTRHNRRVYSLCLRMTQNVAEAEDLAIVVGVSKKDAEAIVRYRQAQGDFPDFDALAKVPEIDVEKLSKGRDAITF